MWNSPVKRAIKRGGAIIGHPLDASRVLVVGDTPLDIEAAHAAGAVGVGVASGHYSVEQLRESGADFVIGSLTEKLWRGGHRDGDESE